MTDNDIKLEVIREYVQAERDRLDITRVDSSYKPEPSGESNNEYALLLDRQLLTTTFGQAGWSALKDGIILEGVYGEVLRRRG